MLYVPPQDITITEQHIKLLGRSYYQYDSNFYEGCTSQDVKRPYGNSDVIGDLYEILYGEPWNRDEHGPMSYALHCELLNIHREMGVVVQILVLATANDFPFEVGRDYHRESRYDALSWRPKRDDNAPVNRGRPARRGFITSPGWSTDSE